MDWKWPQELELVQPVAEGWSGTIYLSRDPASARQVYTRLLSRAAREQADALKAQLLFQATSHHPHILPTTLPEVSGDQVFYSMQPAERGSLRHLGHLAGHPVPGHHAGRGLVGPGRPALRGAALDPLVALDLIRQTAQALAFAHERGTAHGNLKPENILLQPGRALLGREGYHVLVSDFGLNALKSRVGSVYQPHAARAQPSGFGIQTDLYGLGALLLFALTGQDPPPEPTPALGDVPPTYRPLVARALGLTPPFPDVPSFLAALARLLPEEVTRTAPAPAPPVVLRLEERDLEVVPGEVHLIRVWLQTQVPLSAALVVEGLPAEWTTLPPATQLQAGQTVSLPLTLRIPRSARAGHGARRVRLRLVGRRLPSGQATELLAEQTLSLQIAPFHEEALTAQAPRVSGRRAVLSLGLVNRSNQPRRYEWSAALPPGTRLAGPLPAPLTLEPGERTQVTLPLRFSPTLWPRRRSLEVAVQGHSGQGEATGPALRVVTTLTPPPLLPLWASAALFLAGATGVWQVAQVPSIGGFTEQGTAGALPVRGEPLTLHWETTGARAVRIRELPGQALGSSGSLELRAPDTAVTYTLEARGWLRSAQRQLTVRSRPPAPTIAVLSVTPPEVSYGESVTVRWDVKDVPRGAAVTLTPFGKVAPRGEKKFKVTGNQAFVLKLAGSAQGSDASQGSAPQNPAPQAASPQERAQVTLRPPAISRLTLTPAEARPGQTVTVDWEVQGARLVRLNPLGPLPTQGRRSFQIPLDARGKLRYVIKASNGQVEVSDSAELQVRPLQPLITAFRAVPLNPQVGETVKVFWRSEQADGVELRWPEGSQRLPPSGELTLTTTPALVSLTLSAQAAGAPTAERRLTLSPQLPPTRQADQRQADLGQPNPGQPDPRRPDPRRLGSGPGASGGGLPAADQGNPRPPDSGSGRSPAPGTDTAGGTSSSPTPPAQAAGRSPSPPVSSAPVPPAQPEPSQGAAAPVRPAPPSPPLPVSPRAQAPEVQVLGFRTLTTAPRVGSALTLRWNVRGAQQVVLENAQGQRIGVYPAQGTATLWPKRSGEWLLALRVPGSARPLSKLSLTVAPAPTASAKPGGPPRSVQPPSPVVREFRASPAQVQPDQATTLFWKVAGAQQVSIEGLRGPLAGGFFPPSGRVSTGRLRTKTTYILRTGQQKRSLTISVLAPPVQPASPSGPWRKGSPPPAAQDNASPYRALEGSWVHSLGRLSLKISGNRITGTLLSSSAILPSGSLKGTLQGPPEDPSFVGYLVAGGQRRAISLNFRGGQTFEGVYAGKRQRWCGWRDGAAPPC